MDTRPASYPAGDLRVSDAERDRAVSELSDHFQAGRLTLDEFEERSGRALSAKTGRELRGLFADLPRTGGPAQQPGPVRNRGAATVPFIPLFPVALFVVIAAVAASSGHGHHHPMFGALVPIAVVCVICMRVAARRGIGRV